MARFLYWQSRFLTQDGVNSLAYRLIGQSAEQVTFVRDGTRWTVNLSDRNIGLILFMDNREDRRNVGLMLAWAHAHGRLPQCDTILDIGANIGSTTIPFLQETSCRVICVEPVPDNLDLLKRNLQQNSLLERVTIVERAITDRAETVNMVVTPVAFGGSEIDRGAVERPEGIFKHPTKTIAVPTTRIDELTSSLSIQPAQIAFVWCDIQGSEGAVIRTGAPLWRQGVPLWAEIAPHLLSRQDSLEQFLEDVARYFVSFVSLGELAGTGSHAPPHPIEKFPAFVDTLTGEKEMDVLFQPR